MGEKDDLAVYIHWPYCMRICPYCDFNVYKNRADTDLVSAICADLVHWREWGGPALKLLGRDHSGAEAKAALRLASEIFPRCSADLIYGWAGQDETLLARDLDIVLESGIGHISAYQLTIEDGTAFGKAEARGDIKAVDDDKSAEFYDLVRDRLRAAGFVHYEVSNFARPAQSSQHNLAYWQSRDYVGVGPGAHGRMTVEGVRYATISGLRPDDYQRKIDADKNGIASLTELTPQAWGEEYVLMGLRIDEGISLPRYREIAGKTLPQDVIKTLIDDGLLEQNRLINSRRQLPLSYEGRGRQH